MLFVNSRPGRWKWLGGGDDDVLSEVEILSEEESAAHLERPWHRFSTINADTGTLSINLIHLLKFKSSPHIADIFGPLKAYRIDGITCSFYMIIDNFDLDKFVQPGVDHIFVLDEGDSTAFYLILRELGSKRTFSLVTSFHRLYFGMSMPFCHGQQNLLKFSL
jgi:hypothetical protein